MMGLGILVGSFLGFVIGRAMYKPIRPRQAVKNADEKAREDYITKLEREVVRLELKIQRAERAKSQAPLKMPLTFDRSFGSIHKEG